MKKFHERIFPTICVADEPIVIDLPFPFDTSAIMNHSLPRTEFRGTSTECSRTLNYSALTVAIDQPDWINQFNMLPFRWQHEFMDVTVHHDPKWTVVNGEPVFNFSILITSQPEKWEGIVPAEQLYGIKRLGKTKQNAMLNRFIRRSGAQNAVLVPFWGSNFQDGKHTSFLGHDVGGRVVVKPEDGARGVCHMVVDFDKVSVGAFLRDLYTKDVKLVDMHEKYKDHIKIGHGHAWDDAEAQKVKEEGQFTFQRYVENINQEVRILTDHLGNIGFACLRDRSGDDYKQATGVTHLVEQQRLVDEDFLKKWINVDFDIFKELLRDVVGPMSSVDLFITNDGKWGICEFCNQYGIVGVPREYYIKSVRDYVDHCLEQYSTWDM